MKKMLLVRFTPKYLVPFVKNKYLQEKYEFFAFEDIKFKNEYERLELPVNFTYWNHGFPDFEEMDIAVVTQKLAAPSMLLESVYKELGKKLVWAESFFDNRMRFDTIGLDYCPENEIKMYVNKVDVPPQPRIKYPIGTREPQPDNITKREFFEKYKLSEDGKYIVILGQTIIDMSLKYSKNRYVQGYEDFIDLVVSLNPDVTFLMKLHPHYYGVFKEYKEKHFGFLRKYSNIVEIYESLDTLFNIFDCFCSFSSTTIFEGIIKSKKFATVGYHFCDTDKLVYQLTDISKFLNLYEKLSSFVVDSWERQKYLYFVCNYYTVPLDSEQLLMKMELNPDEYYARIYN